MSIFILCKSDAPKESIQALCDTLKELGHECDTSLEKPGLKDHLQSKYIIFFLTKECLRDKELVNKFVLSTSRKIKYCIVVEGDETKGSKLKSGDFASIDIEAIVKDKKALPKARKALGDVSVIPYRSNTSFSSYCIQQILHCFDLKPLKEAVSVSSSLSNVKLTDEDLNEPVKQLFEDLEKAPPKANMNFIGYKDKQSEFLFSNKLISDLDGKVALACHLFDKADYLSTRGNTCLENICSQFSNQIPEYISGFSSPTYSVEDNFNELFIKPTKKILKRKQYAFLILRNVNDGNKNDINVLLHLLQTIKLPKWLRVIITGDHEFCAEFALIRNKTNIIQEIDYKYDHTIRYNNYFKEISSSIDINKFVVCCSLVTSPIPSSILTKMFNKEIEDISIELNKYQIIDLIQIEQKKYFKSANFQVESENENEVVDELFKTINDLMISSKDEVELFFAFNEYVLVAAKAGQFDLLVTKLFTPSWLFDRIRYGVGTLLYQLREVVVNFKLSNEIESKISSIYSFIQACKGPLYRDYREFSAQMIGFMKTELVELDIYDTVSNLQVDSKSIFLPLGDTLRTPSNIVDNITIDSYLSNQLYFKVSIAKHVEDYIVCGTDDGDIIIYSAEKMNLQRLKTFKIHNRKITCIQSQGYIVLAASEDGSASLFNVKNGKILHTFVGLKMPPIGCFFVQDSYLLITKGGAFLYSQDFALKFECSFERASTVTNLFLEPYIAALGFTSGDISLVSITDKGIELETLKEKAHSRGIVSISSTSSNPTILVSGGFDRKIEIFNIETKNILKTITKTGPISSVLLMKENIYLTSIESAVIQSFSMTGDKLSSFNISGFGCETICEVNEDSLFIVGTNYIKRILNLSKTGIPSIEYHNDWIKCVAVSTSSAEVATGDISGRIAIWDSNTGAHKRSLQCESYVGNLFVFSIDGKYLLSRVGAWDATTGVRVPYMDIDKANRHPLKKDFEQEAMKGYLNLVESDDGLCFSSNSADSVVKALLPKSDHRKESIAMCCSGRQVHFLQVLSSS